MSHVATVQVEIKDLDCLEAAAKRCGLVFKRDQKEFKWYGRWMNDYAEDDAAYKALGIDPKDYGKCIHAIGIEGDKSAYEIGIVNNPKGGYALLWDFYAGGHGLMKHVHADSEKTRSGIGKLQQAYAIEVAKKNARKQGFSVSEKQQKDGSIKLVCTR